MEPTSTRGWSTAVRTRWDRWHWPVSSGSARPRRSLGGVRRSSAGFGPLQRHLDDPTVEEIWVNERLTAGCRVGSDVHFGGTTNSQRGPLARRSRTSRVAILAPRVSARATYQPSYIVTLDRSSHARAAHAP